MKPKYDIPFTPDEEKIQRTVSASLTAFRAGQEQQRAGYLAFLLHQSRYIRKRWWALQGLLLALMGWLLRQMQTDLAVRRCLGTIAPLFALLILPELWKTVPAAPRKLRAPPSIPCGRSMPPGSPSLPGRICC